MKEEKRLELGSYKWGSEQKQGGRDGGKGGSLNHTLFQNVITTFNTLYSNLKIDN